MGQKYIIMYKPKSEDYKISAVNDIKVKNI